MIVGNSNYTLSMINVSTDRNGVGGSLWMSTMLVRKTRKVAVEEE